MFTYFKQKSKNKKKKMEENKLAYKVNHNNTKKK